MKDNGDIATVEQYQSDDEVNERVTLIRDCCSKLGRSERYNLAYLARFCQIIKEEVSSTMMSANALVYGVFQFYTRIPNSIFIGPIAITGNKVRR